MGRTFTIISYLTIALVTCYSAHEYLQKSPTFFTGTLIAYLLYAITGVILYALDENSNSIYNIHSLGLRLVMSLGLTLYAVEILLKDGSVPEEVSYCILAAGCITGLLAIAEDGLRYTYTDILICLNTLLLGFTTFNSQDKMLFMATISGLLAYHVYRNDVVISNKDPRVMCNFFHSAFLVCASQTVN